MKKEAKTNFKKILEDSKIKQSERVFQKYIKGIKIVVKAASLEEAEQIFNSYNK